MIGPLAVVPPIQEVAQPDLSWIKKHVPVSAVGRSLGMHIRKGKARCWRWRRHANGDANPSLHFFERHNRVRCFVCDMRGGHSCVDLVMEVLGIELSPAIRWIAERWTVPSVKPGRPLGRGAKEPAPYQVGFSGLEVVVRSGMFGELSATESRILVVLEMFKDRDSGATRLSYAAICRYAGLSSRNAVSRALGRLQRLHAIQISRGARLGITRVCSIYRVTLEDPAFIDRCNQICSRSRNQIVAERQYRRDLRAAREKQARETKGQNVNKAGGLRPPNPPFLISSSELKNTEQKPNTCEGLNLSMPGIPRVNKSVRAGYPLIRTLSCLNVEERTRELARQAKLILETYGTGKKVGEGESA